MLNFTSLPHGSVDRNLSSGIVLSIAPRSLPHGSVDRNNHVGHCQGLNCGRSLTGAWIETVRRLH